MAKKKQKKQPRDASGRFKKKSYGNPGANIWTPIGRSPGYGTYDVFGSQPEPNAYELLAGYEDIVYACVNLISNNIAAIPLRLCATTSHNQDKPKSATKSLATQDRNRIDRDHRKYTRKAVDVAEVVDHPLLDLLEHPNPEQSLGKLMHLTQTYLELIGSAFWYLAKDDITKQIKEIWLLPSHLIKIKVNDGGAVVGYTFGGNKEEYYTPDKIIHFKFTNPLDPYSGFGMPPVRAVWQRVMLLRQEQSSWQAILTNLAAPGTIVHPPDNETWTDMQAERVAKQVSERFRMGNGGGTWVIQDHVEIAPFAPPPKDLGALAIWDQIRTSVCNAYSIPKMLVDETQGNLLTSADIAYRFFEMNCLKPRIVNLLDTLTHRLCPDRLFFCTDEIVRPDKQFELQRTSALWQANLLTQNEARRTQGLAEVKDGDKFLFELIGAGEGGGTMGTLPSFQQDSAPPLKTKAQKYTSKPPNPEPLVKKLREVIARQRDRVLSKFKNADGLTTKAWMRIEDWNKEFAEAVEPVLRVIADQGAGAIMAEVGGDDTLARHAVQELDRAVSRLALVFADSTNQTTNMEITEAVEATRRAIAEGLEQGEANAQLATRIGEIFTDLSERRVMLIAETESSRVKHTGELIAITSSGIEAKKVWLCDNMACDKCRPLNGKAVDIGKTFATKEGGGPYAEVDCPPYHPGCRCTLQYELEGLNK